LCTAYTFLLGNLIGEGEFWIFSHTWQEYVKNGFLKKLECLYVYMPLKAGSMGLLLKTAINFVIAKTVFFTSCSTDRLSRMLCCTELVGSGKVNKTGFRSLSRYKRFILLFFYRWRFSPFRAMASRYTG
jgi:hypothetical protein